MIGLVLCTYFSNPVDHVVYCFVPGCYVMACGLFIVPWTFDFFFCPDGFCFWAALGIFFYFSSAVFLL